MCFAEAGDRSIEVDNGLAHLHHSSGGSISSGQSAQANSMVEEAVALKSVTQKLELICQTFDGKLQLQETCGRGRELRLAGLGGTGGLLLSLGSICRRHGEGEDLGL